MEYCKKIYILFCIFIRDAPITAPPTPTCIAADESSVDTAASVLVMVLSTSDDQDKCVSSYIFKIFLNLTYKENKYIF